MLLPQASLNTETCITAEKAGAKPLSGITWLILTEAFLVVLVAERKFQSMEDAELLRRGILSYFTEGKGAMLLFLLYWRKK